MKPTKTDESKNGVRVIVHRGENGSYVEADCHCYGSFFRTHSSALCPLAKRYQPAPHAPKEPT